MIIILGCITSQEFVFGPLFFLYKIVNCGKNVKKYFLEKHAITTICQEQTKQTPCLFCEKYGGPYTYVQKLFLLIPIAMNKKERKQLVAYFLKKSNNTLAKKLLGEMENFSDTEWNYLYGIIFGETEKEKVEALRQYMSEIEDIKKRYSETESKMRRLASQMEELIDSIQEDADADSLLKKM